MLSDLKILNIASALSRHSTQRHQVIAENIANADTRGYKAKDVEAFSTAYDRMVRSTQSLSNGTTLAEQAFQFRTQESAQEGAISPNGNTVSLEDQMMKSVEAQQSHEAASLIYKKSITLLRMSMGKNV